MSNNPTSSTTSTPHSPNPAFDREVSKLLLRHRTRIIPARTSPTTKFSLLANTRRAVSIDKHTRGYNGRSPIHSRSPILHTPTPPPTPPPYHPANFRSPKRPSYQKIGDIPSPSPKSKSIPSSSKHPHTSGGTRTTPVLSSKRAAVPDPFISPTSDRKAIPIPIDINIEDEDDYLLIPSHSPISSVSSLPSALIAPPRGYQPPRDEQSFLTTLLKCKPWIDPLVPYLRSKSLKMLTIHYDFDYSTVTEHDIGVIQRLKPLIRTGAAAVSGQLSFDDRLLLVRYYSFGGDSLIADLSRMSPRELLGDDYRTEYRSLARILHPDKCREGAFSRRVYYIDVLSKLFGILREAYTARDGPDTL
eukprot:gnl/Dysnectes_brevis/4366_a5832_684.p1 GENE.gnl/Dysnectes_brevis/4366_a5832_684~~gnl/Dysnectes_brevis/4366_a5832_684.p1  ORF type:complete len:390 (+),score=5.35 gnl/Dysnectes_brevis/4366_a5832_684:96-1172(+)